MSWFLLTVFSVISLAIAELAQRYVLHVKKSFDERVSLALTFLIQFALAIPIILFSSLRNQIYTIFNTDVIFPTLILSIIASYGNIAYYNSLKVKNISISTIFVSISVVVSTTLGILVFNESFYTLKLVGILLVIIAVASLNIKNLTLEKNHLWGLLAGLIFGFGYVLSKKIVISVNPLIFIFWSYPIVSLLVFLQKPGQIIASIKKSTSSMYVSVIISGIGYFLYNILTLFAYRLGGEVGRVDAINNAQIFLIILVEYFVFKQKSGIKRKLVAALIAFTGVYILGFY